LGTDFFGSDDKPPVRDHHAISPTDTAKKRRSASNSVIGHPFFSREGRKNAIENAV
jgi:hypothetical protein